MNVAIPLHGNRVSPRFEYCRDFLVVQVKEDREVGRKALNIEIESPVQIAEVFAREGIDLVLSGGMNPAFQREFRLRNIGVIWGLIGEAGDVMAAYLKGKAFAGMGPCPPAQDRGLSPREKKGR